MVSTFVRATEVWVPTADGSSIDLIAGLYAEELRHFEAISRGLRRAYGEGLAGKAWERGQPIILKNLENSFFNRYDAAHRHELACVVALPIFAGPVLKSMLVFLCNDDLQREGAIELWCAPEGEAEITLVDGYFGTASGFETITREAAFGRGTGLPGGVWETGLPLLIPELARSAQFARKAAAEDVGFRRAVGWPCAVRGGGAWVMAFLSSRKSPIAGRFENWLPTGADGQFSFQGGFCESGADLAAQWSAPLAVDAFAEVGETFVPIVTDDPAARLGEPGRSARDAGLTRAIVLPILSGSRLKAILTVYL
jgi:hypothetical protein